MIPAEVYAVAFVGCAAGAAVVGWRMRALASPRPLAARAGTVAAALAQEGAAPEPFLARFVVNAEGARVGETVFVSATEVIVKGALRKFLLFPADRVEVRDGDLVLAADTDMGAAESAGEAWRAREHDAIRHDEEGAPVKEGDNEAGEGARDEG